MNLLPLNSHADFLIEMNIPIEFFQVVIEIRIKGVKPEEAKIAINTKSLSVTAKLPASSTYAKMDSDYR